MVSSIGIIVLILFLSLLFMAWVAIEYILTAVGLYRLSAAHQISNPWMSWLPLFKDWIIGKLAEKEDESHGIRRKWSMVLIIMDVIVLCSAIIFWIAYVIYLISVIGTVASQSYSSELDETAIVTIVVGLILLILVAVVMSLSATAATTCQMLCMYKVFEICVSKGTWKSWLIYMLVPIYGSYRLYRCVNQWIAQQHSSIDPDIEYQQTETYL